MTIHFKEDLRDLAVSIIEAKGTADDTKSDNYLYRINKVFDSYDGQMSSIEEARRLDAEIRAEYPFCDALDNYQSARTFNNAPPAMNQQYVPEEIRRLNVDRYGIFFTTLYNKGKAKCIEDFIDYIE